MNETEDIRTDYDLAPFKQTDIAITAMASMGLSYTLLGKDIIAKVFAYGIRDAKDGIKEKIIVN